MKMRKMRKLTRQEKINMYSPDKDSEVLIIKTGFFEMIRNGLRRRFGLTGIGEEKARRFCAYCNWVGKKGSCGVCSRMVWYPDNGTTTMVRFLKKPYFDPKECRDWIFYLSRFDRLRLRLFGSQHD